MTLEEIEADMKAVKANNPDWASNRACATVYLELLRVRERLIETPAPQPLPGKY